MHIVLLGPPGAGKGTQAKRLTEAYDFVHLSSGDLLRAECRAGTELGRRVAEFIDAGRLVPDQMIVEVVLARLKALKGASGFLLDGFPRTITQAESLDAALQGCGEKIDLVLKLAVPDEYLVDRIVGRRTCPTCQHVYHVRFHPPIREGICDRDGASLVQRTDDTREVVLERLVAYAAQTRPLVDYYRRRGILREVDGARDIEDVLSDLRRAVDDAR